MSALCYTVTRDFYRQDYRPQHSQPEGHPPNLSITLLLVNRYIPGSGANNMQFYRTICITSCNL